MANKNIQTDFARRSFLARGETADAGIRPDSVLNPHKEIASLKKRLNELQARRMELENQMRK
jgi:hypothetical protein